MLHLPQDIQYCIVKQLSDEILTAPEHHNAWRIAMKTLSSLCLTSRGMCALAQPLLYRKFVRLSKTLKPDTVHGINIVHIGAKATETLELFIRTLLDRPSLANHVWFIRLQERTDEEREDDSDFVPPVSCCDDSDVLMDYESWLHTLVQTTEVLDEIRSPDSPRGTPALDSESDNHDWHDQWCSDLAEGRDDAAIALLLTLVPNLKHLDIESDHPMYSRHLNMLIEQFLGVASWVKDERSSTASVRSFRLVTSIPLPRASSPFLSQLESLTLFKDGWNCASDDVLYMPLMYIPTLTSLNLIEIGNFFKLEPAKHQMPPLRNLQHLRVECYSYWSRELLTLVASCKQLKSFEYVSRADFSTASFDQKWLDILAERANTLERLQLRSALANNYSRDMIRLTNGFDLRRMSKLVSLEISQIILFPKSSSQELEFSDLLPSSLESLTMRDVDATFAATLSRFVEQKGCSYFPRLRYFELVEARVLADTHTEDAQTSQSLAMNQTAWSATRLHFVDMCRDLGLGYKVWSEDAKMFANKADYKDWPERVKNHVRVGVSLLDL